MLPLDLDYRPGIQERRWEQLLKGMNPLCCLPVPGETLALNEVERDVSEGLESLRNLESQNLSTHTHTYVHVHIYNKFYICNYIENIYYI